MVKPCLLLPFARETLHLVDPVLTPFFSFRQDGSDASNVKNAEDIPSGWNWERFEIINARAPDGSMPDGCPGCKGTS